MKILKPILITSNMIHSTNIPDSSHSIWSYTATYAPGNSVVAENNDGIEHEYTWLPPDEDSISATSIYPPLTHSVINRSEMDPGAKSSDDNYRCYWLDRGPANRHAMFDQRSRRVSSRGDDITVSVAPGELVNALALINVKADALSITVTDPVDGEVYSAQVDMLDLSNVYDIYTWCFAPILKKSTAVLLNLPFYPAADITVSATNPGETVQIGELVFGQVIDIGIMLYDMAISGTDYSKTTVDDEGNTTLKVGSYAKEVSYPVKLLSSRLNYISKVFDDLRGRPAVFIGLEDREESIIYALCTDFSEVFSSESISRCNITTKEISL